MAESETPETEVQPQEGVKKPSTTPKAIRLATISKLLEKHTAQMERVGRMVQPLQTQIDSIAKVVQPLQKQLTSIERQTEFNCPTSLNNYKSKCRKFRKIVRK
jgi:predicted RNase H-like nuclease (RuvC/YqgF family)